MKSVGISAGYLFVLSLPRKRVECNADLDKNTINIYVYISTNSSVGGGGNYLFSR